MQERQQYWYGYMVHMEDIIFFFLSKHQMDRFHGRGRSRKSEDDAVKSKAAYNKQVI